MFKPKKLRFGSAGIPIGTPARSTLNGIKYVRHIDLDCMELEFVRGINISEEKAPEVKKVAKKNDVVLTNHAPYYINLNSNEKAKAKASQHRIYRSAYIAGLCGGYSSTFHAAYYMKQNSEKVYMKVKKYIKQIVEKLQNNSANIWLRPETTGKPTQWGDIKEIVRLSQEVEQVLPCIDFSHVYTRSIGKINTYDKFREIFVYLEKELGRTILNNMHAHMSGIVYGEKGERHHEPLQESKFNYQAVIKLFKEFKIKGCVISESPLIERDAKIMQKYYNKL